MEQNKALVIAIVDRMKTVLNVQTDKELSEKLEGSRGQISVWKTRGTLPFAECLDLAVKYSVSLDWLILGRGAKDVTEPVFDESGAHLSEMNWREQQTFKDSVPGTSWFIPGEWFEQQGLGAGGLMAVRASSDVMSPFIGRGDVALIDLTHPGGDGVAFMEFSGGYHFRRIQHLADGSLRLSCDNPAYATEVVAPADRGHVRIIGYCYMVMQRVR